MRPIFLFAILILFSGACHRQKKEVNIVGHDPVNSYTDELEQLYRVELLPQYRAQSTVAEISSYDTTGGNNDGFSGLYSYIRKEGHKLVIAELEGPGVIERIWTPTPSLDTIQFYFDGEDIPRINIPFIDLFSGNEFPFIHPIAGNEVGGYYCYVPIPYRRSCKIVYSGEKMLFHQIQYRKFEDARDIRSFPEKWTDDQRESLHKAVEFWTEGSKFHTARMDSIYRGRRTVKKEFTVNAGQEVEIFNADTGGRILRIGFDPADEFSGLNKDILMEARWDDDASPAIYSPVADLFGYAYGKPSMHGILIGSTQGKNYCLLPMPFDRKAVIRIIYKKREGSGQPPVHINSEVTWAAVQRNSDLEGKFYTQWRREVGPGAGKPYIFQQSTGKGHHIGTILQAQGLKAGMTRFFEGDDSTVVDGVMRLHGTGSEDYFNGGWYALVNRWDKAFSLPVHGCLEYSIPFSRTGGYRFYLTDKIPFRESLLHTIEHGPVGNNYPVDYTSVAFYYADQPPASVMEPETDLRTVYIPDTLMVLADNMTISIGLRATVDFTDWGVNNLSGWPESRVEILLDDIPGGNYKLLITYLKHPDGSDFSVWQRQRPVSGLISSYASEELRTVDQFAGDILLDEQYNSVTLMKESDDHSKTLTLYGLRLIKK